MGGGGGNVGMLQLRVSLMLNEPSKKWRLACAVDPDPVDPYNGLLGSDPKINFKLRIRAWIHFRILNVYQDSRKKVQYFIIFNGLLRRVFNWSPRSGYVSQDYGSEDPDPKKNLRIHNTSFNPKEFQRMLEVVFSLI